ncbi:MAG TPA: hypothetical protein VFV50_05720 [Bdellovibrionales bacterium]|nr:hypothetical protein [Bdellovibrionales bacterium]
MKKIIWVIAALWAGLGSPAAAFASSCLPADPSRGYLKTADLIFAGKAVSLNRSTVMTVEFSVSKVWKGDSKQQRMTVQTSVGELGYNFEKGTEYLVFATLSRTDFKTYHTHICDLTRPLANAASDIAALDKEVAAKAEDANVAKKDQPIPYDRPLPPKNTSDKPSPRYDEFVKFFNGLDYKAIALDYAGAVRKLTSENSGTRMEGLKMLAATNEADAIAWIVPHLSDRDPNVATEAWFALGKLVESNELKRRDKLDYGTMKLCERRAFDRDLRPLRWLLVSALEAPNDHRAGKAATMISYLGLKEEKASLEAFAKRTPHPAYRNSVEHYIHLLGPDGASKSDYCKARDVLSPDERTHR